MSLKITASVLISLVLATAKCDTEKDLVKAFRSNEVVPDVIPTPPAEELHIRYAKAEREVDLGNELTPMQVRDQPTVHFDAEPDGFYTLIMIDLDVPSRKNPVYREGNHWLVVNIPGNNIEKGEILTEYIGSTPPKDTGLHRYVFLVYRQPQMLTFDEPHKSNRDSNRGNFSVKKFADKYKLGQPIAGNFFEAQYDDSVPETQKQFGL